MSTLEEEILTKARKLAELEKSFLKYTYEAKSPENKEDFEEYIRKTVDISSEAFELKNEILSDFHEISNLTIYDPVVVKVLDKIRQNEKLYSVSFYEGMAGLVNKDTQNWQDRWDTTIEGFLASSDKDFFDEFFSWFGIYDYYAALCKIGPIISSFHTPENIVSYFDEIREAFAFGQYRSSIALCRALLEMALFDKLDRKKAFDSQSSKVTSIDIAKEDNLFKFINLSRYYGIIDNNKKELAHSIRKKANAVLHIRDRNEKPTKRETFEIIFDTVKFIEFLYR